MVVVGPLSPFRELGPDLAHDVGLEIFAEYQEQKACLYILY
jgi:hypothetical protein